MYRMTEHSPVFPAFLPACSLLCLLDLQLGVKGAELSTHAAKAGNVITIKVVGEQNSQVFR